MWKKFIITLLSISAILNIAACSENFCNWYTENIYQFIASNTGYIFSKIPVAAGEIFMYLGAAALITALILMILFIFFRKKTKFRNFTKYYLKILSSITACFILIYTTNWIIPFRTTPMNFNSEPSKKYTIEDLISLYNHIAEEINYACQNVERDENGYPAASSDMDEIINHAMSELGQDYHFTSDTTFFPKLKTALCSDFLEWMNIGGYTYPFTMEMTGNKYISDFYYPALTTHEMAHHFGFYRENEANFISYLSGHYSDDMFFKYSTSYHVLYYVTGAFFDSLDYSFETFDEKAPYIEQLIPIDSEVETDVNYFLGIVQEIYDSEVNTVLENTVSETVENVGDKGWSIQKDILKEACYDGVTELLLKYYDK